MDQTRNIEARETNVARRPQPEPNAERLAAAQDLPITIAELAREFSVTLRALRFYENKRLLSPQRDGAVRLYGRRERERLALILQGRRLGFTLAEIAELSAARGGGESSALRLTRATCVDQIKLLERRKREIELAIAELRRIYSSFYEDSVGAARR